MTIFISGIFLFLFAFAVHVVVWRLHLPKRQMKVLLYIFGGVLIVGLLIIKYSSIVAENYPANVPSDFFEYLHIVFLYGALVLAYLVTYSAVEVDSPSLVMVTLIADAGFQGIAKDDFEQKMGDDILVVPRLRDLVSDKMVFIKNGTYILTAKGILLARIFIFYRKLLRASKGG